MRYARVVRPRLDRLRRLGAGLLAAAVVAAVGGAAGVAAAPREPARPSVVLVPTDDQRWDTLWGMRTVSEGVAAHGEPSDFADPLQTPRKGARGEDRPKEKRPVSRAFPDGR